MRERFVQEEYRLALIEAATGLAEQARSLGTDLDDRQLSWDPPSGGWSIGEVLEHLCLVNDSYFDRLSGLLDRSLPAESVDPGREWEATWMGDFWSKSMNWEWRLPTVRRYNPVAQRPAIVEEYLLRQDRLLALIDRAAPYDWNTTRMHAPASRFIKLNLGDCFTLILAHEVRHMKQVIRIRAQRQFPH